MSNNENKILLNKENSIGSFAAYIRRPKPMNTGYIATFFGDNGQDADVITTLSLTQYLNMDVAVNVYLIKDSIGVDMRNPDTNRYPIISSFIGKIQRSKPSDLGMTAQIFAPNGNDSDQVNILGGTAYLDSLVLVDLRGKKTSSNPNIYDNDESIQEDILKNHAWKVSEKEKQDYIAKVKKFQKINLELHDSNLFLNEKLMDTISDFDEKYTYKNFILNESVCCYKHIGKSCEERKGLKQVYINEASHLSKKYSFLPFCSEHLPLIENSETLTINYDVVDGKRAYIEMKNIIEVKKWVWNFFIKEFSLTGHEEPDSVKMLVWLSENGFQDDLPVKFIKDTLKISK